MDPSTSTCFQFTVTPAKGIFLLERISFGTRLTASGSVSLTLRASAHGYASDLTAPVSTANDSMWRSVSIPLTFPIHRIDHDHVSPLWVRRDGHALGQLRKLANR
ncbi:MAG: hypothetical protein FJ275_14340 [Planctomycetes bacterium]|nr:hypothetical protein [Planctomycetota bacterium]